MQDKNISYLAEVCSDIFKLIRWERRGGMEGRKDGGRERIHSDSNDLDLEGWHCKWLSLGVTTAILCFFEEITNLDFFFT